MAEKAPELSDCACVLVYRHVATIYLASEDRRRQSPYLGVALRHHQQSSQLAQLFTSLDRLFAEKFGFFDALVSYPRLRREQVPPAKVSCQLHVQASRLLYLRRVSVELGQ